MNTWAQTQAQFQIPITVTNGPDSRTLYIGINGDGPGGVIQDNTIGVDYEGTFGDYQELVAPPPPPAPYDFDTRIITIPGRVSTFPTGLGGGVFKDFRGFESASQVDSFRILIQGDAIDVQPTVITWPANLAQYASQMVIKPQSGSEWEPVDMLANSQATIPAGILQKNIIIIKTGALTSVQQIDDVIPVSHSLHQNYPNPFNPATEIRFSVPERSRVGLGVYNMLGQRVSMLVDETLEAGNYTVRFDASGLSSGMYFYRLEAGGFTEERKMLLLK